MKLENNSEWQYRFLKAGTEYGFGDLSAMVNVVGGLLKEERNAAIDEERQFVLNILDGIDIADKEMGVTGGTQAIRKALQSRI